MKKTLVLMRHGEAANAPLGGSDFERALTPKGEAMVRAQAREMIEKGLWPDLILCSSSTRTRQTCDILRIASAAATEPKVEYRSDIYNAVPSDLMKILWAQDDARNTILIVGHNPTLHQLSMLLTAPDVVGPRVSGQFPPGSFTAFDFELPSWGEIGENMGNLRQFIMPKA